MYLLLTCAQGLVLHNVNNNYTLTFGECIYAYTINIDLCVLQFSQTV